MGQTRKRRVGELIRQELSGLLRSGLRDPRLKELTVTEVEMSPDLKKAHVYYACPRDKVEAVREGLAKADGFIRRTISQKVYLKFMPELVFTYDDSLDRGEAMDSLLDSLDPQPGPDRDSEGLS